MNSKLKSKSISDSDYDEIICHVMKAEEIPNNTLVSEKALQQLKDYIEGNHRHKLQYYSVLTKFVKRDCVTTRKCLQWCIYDPFKYLRWSFFLKKVSDQKLLS